MRCRGLVMSLDVSDPMPLWAQLASELRRRLGAGEFDERFPTEADLVAVFGVSRATVREAIRRLREEGLLDARRGSGTFVVRRQLDAPILGSAGLPQHFLNFLPEPQGQGSLRPTFVDRRSCSRCGSGRSGSRQ